MTPKPSYYQCTKCKAPGTAATAACGKCGARVEKFCGECGQANSPAKKYCDQCGSRLIVPENPAPPKEAPPPSFSISPGIGLKPPASTEPPGIASRGIPKTGVVRLDAGAMKTPLPGRAPATPGAPMGSGIDPFRGPPPAKARPRSADATVQTRTLRLFTGLAALAALTAGGLYWMRHKAPAFPKLEISP